MKQLLLFSLVCLSSILISCNKDEEAKPIDSTTVTLSGFENGTYELDATFSYSVARGASLLNINIEKMGTPSFELILFLNEFGDSEGFELGTYSYFDDPENLFYDVVLRMSGKNFQILETEISGTNQIEFTSITEGNFKGRFEANIVSANFSGGYDKINVSGTFDAARVF